MIRATMVAIALLAVPLTANAQYIDLIGNKLNEGCSLEKYLGIVEEFRGVMKSEGYPYTVEIAQPLTGEDLGTVWWIGRSQNLATFGEGYTRWETALTKAGSPEAKVSQKLNDCATNISRSGSLIR